MLTDGLGNRLEVDFPVWQLVELEVFDRSPPPPLPCLLPDKPKPCLRHIVLVPVLCCLFVHKVLIWCELDLACWLQPYGEDGKMCCMENPHGNHRRIPFVPISSESYKVPSLPDPLFHKTFQHL